MAAPTILALNPFDYEHPRALCRPNVQYANHVNARLDIRQVGGSGLDAGVFVRNVFDKNYLASSNVGSAQLGIMSGFYGAPRTYGIELRYHFGN